MVDMASGLRHMRTAHLNSLLGPLLSLNVLGTQWLLLNFLKALERRRVRLARGLPLLPAAAATIDVLYLLSWVET